MPQINFTPPKDRSWVASALKELGRDAKKAANETKSKEETEVQKQIVILDQQGNYKDSMKILADYGLRPLTYQEALVMIDQNPEIKEQLKGKSFYLEGKGINLSGCYTFNDKGELTQGKGDMEKTVYVWKGSEPLSLGVLLDDNSRGSGRRFTLGACAGPFFVVHVVVGVRTQA